MTGTNVLEPEITLEQCKHGFTSQNLLFQGSFPTMYNRTSISKLPPSITILSKRTYLGMIEVLLSKEENIDVLK